MTDCSFAKGGKSFLHGINNLIVLLYPAFITISLFNYNDEVHMDNGSSWSTMPYHYVLNKNKNKQW